MPHLLIDIGNSFAKYAIYDAGKLSAVKKITTKSLELNNSIALLLNESSIIPTGIILVSVTNKKLTINIIKSLESYFRLSVKNIETQALAFGVTCGYRYYEQLGNDRWVAMLGAFNSSENEAKAVPMMIFDCGSVITVDVVNSSGIHVGGWMMPNTQLLASALEQKSEAIHLGLAKDELNAEINNNKQKKLDALGCSTFECVELGHRLAVVGFIKQCMERANNKLGIEPNYIFTGGGANEIKEMLDMEVEFRPNLVFDGLKLFIE